MKILLICSKSFYDKLHYYKKALEDIGHEVYMPNCWNAPETEAKFRGTPEHHILNQKCFANQKKQ